MDVVSSALEEKLVLLFYALGLGLGLIDRVNFSTSTCSVGSIQKPKRRRKTAKVGKKRRKSTKDAETRRKTADNVVILKNLSKLVNTIHT